MASQSVDTSYARIVTIEGRQIELSRQEYRIIQSALESWSRELDEEAAAAGEDGFDALQAEAKLADTLWRRL